MYRKDLSVVKSGTCLLCVLCASARDKLLYLTDTYKRDGHKKHKRRKIILPKFVNYVPSVAMIKEATLLNREGAKVARKAINFLRFKTRS